jgi:hypothetical protein
MRLKPRQRANHPRAPRIAISQEEIAADLHYPVRRPAPPVGAVRSLRAAR